MNNRKTVYLVEGGCEKALIDALKGHPAVLQAGKVHVYNVTSKCLSRGFMMTITPGSEVVLVFDTDTDDATTLLKNLQLLAEAGASYKIITIPQVNNFEDEIVRSTDVRKPSELTNSKSLSNFKADFIRVKDCRALLDKHGFRIEKLWTRRANNSFSNIVQMSMIIKK